MLHKNATEKNILKNCGHFHFLNFGKMREPFLNLNPKAAFSVIDLGRQAVA